MKGVITLENNYEQQDAFGLNDLQTILQTLSVLHHIPITIRYSDNNSIKVFLDKILSKNSIFQIHENIRSICEECYLEAIKSAAGDRINKLFQCIHGLTSFIFPLYHGESLFGYLIAGPIRIVKNLEKPKKGKSRPAKKSVKRSITNLADGVNILTRKQVVEAEKLLESLSVAITRTITRSVLSNQKVAEMQKMASGPFSSFEITKLTEDMFSELKGIVSYNKSSIQLIKDDSRFLIASSGFGINKIDQWMLRSVDKDPLIKKIVEGREPFILSDTSIDDDWEYQPGTNDVKSWIGLPIIFRDKVIGLITIDHNQSGYYTYALKDSLKQYANRISSSMWFVFGIFDANRIIRDLDIINEIIQVISTKLGTEDLLYTIVKQISTHLYCSHCTIFVQRKIDGQSCLVPQATYGGDKKTMTRIFPLNKNSLATSVFKSGKSEIIANALEDERFAEAREKKPQPRSMLIAPIKVGDQTIGIISADQDAYGWFVERDKSLLDTLAQQTGIAIQRSLAIKLIQEISDKILGQDNIENILKDLVDGAIELINVSTGNIYLISEDGLRVIKEYNHKDFTFPPPRLGKKDGITRKVIDTGKIESIPDVKSDTRVHPEIQKYFNSMIAIPLKYDKKVIGVFFLDDIDQHIFNETEQELLLMLANQAVVAIHNAETRDWFKILFDRSPDGVVIIDPHGAQGAWPIIDCNEAFCAMNGYTKTELIDRTITPDINVLNIHPAPREQYYQNLKELKTIKAEIVHRHRDGTEFPIETLSCLININGKEYVLGIDRNITETKRLFEIAQTVAHMTVLGNFKETLNKIVQETVNNLDCDVVTLYTYDDASKMLRNPPTYAGKLFYKERIEQSRIVDENSVAYTLLYSDKPFINVLDTSENKDFINTRFTKEEKIKSLIAVPLRMMDQKVGVMFVNYRTRHEFTDDELKNIKLFTDQAAVAICNAQLFDEIDAKRKALENSVDKELLRMFSLMGNVINHRIGNSVGMIRTILKDLLENKKIYDEITLEEFDTMLRCSERVLSARKELREKGEKLLFSEPSPIDFKKVANILLENEEINSKHGYSLVLKDIATLPPINANFDLFMEGVLIELIRNGFKSMPHGGKVALTGKKTKDMIEIRVKDTGIGIKPEYIKEIFEEGISRWPDGEHTGKGLAYLKVIVEFYRGTVKVESKIDVGTTFILNIPIVQS